MCIGPRTELAGFVSTTWPIDQVVEQHPDGGEVLLDRRGLVSGAKLLDVGGDHDRLDHVEVELSLLAPVGEPADGEGVREAGVLVADVGREELDEALGGALAGVRDEAGQLREAGRTPEGGLTDRGEAFSSWCPRVCRGVRGGAVAVRSEPADDRVAGRSPTGRARSGRPPRT